MSAPYTHDERASAYWKLLIDYYVRPVLLILDALVEGRVQEKPHIAPTQIWVVQLSDLSNGLVVSKGSSVPELPVPPTPLTTRTVETEIFQLVAAVVVPLP